MMDKPGISTTSPGLYSQESNSQLTAADFNQAQLFLASLPTPFTTAKTAPLSPLSSQVMTLPPTHQLITTFLQPTAQPLIQPITDLTACLR